MQRTTEVSMYEGRVSCPYAPAGSVDVELCYRCPRLLAFRDEESGTKVVCRKGWGGGAPSALPLEWPSRSRSSC